MQWSSVVAFPSGQRVAARPQRLVATELSKIPVGLPAVQPPGCPPGAALVGHERWGYEGLSHGHRRVRPWEVLASIIILMSRWVRSKEWAVPPRPPLRSIASAPCHVNSVLTFCLSAFSRAHRRRGSCMSLRTAARIDAEARDRSREPPGSRQDRQLHHDFPLHAIRQWTSRRPSAPRSPSLRRTRTGCWPGHGGSRSAPGR